MTKYEKLTHRMNCYGFGTHPMDYWVRLLQEANTEGAEKAGLYPETVRALRAALMEYFFGE